MTDVLILDKVRKSYAGMQAVKDLSLTLKGGEFVTLLGPSGCGKTTTLRLIGGFEIPDRGRILIQGKDSTNLPPHKRAARFVFQDYALFPHLNVRRNIAFGLELKGMERRAIERRVDEMLELVQMRGFDKRAPSELSGGQQQRIALARALAPDPPLLLLDEPLSALDAKLRKEMQIELRHLQRKTGKTFVLVTHDQEEALTMSDTVVVMSNGEIEQIGTPWGLYNRPRSEFVARFVGDMNFLPGRIVAQGDSHVELDWAGSRLAGQAPAPQARLDAECVLAVRPEHIRLSTAQPAGQALNRARGRVRERIFRGANVCYVIEVNGTDVAVSAPQRTLRDDENEVWISWDVGHGLVLGPDMAGRRGAQ